MGGAVMGADLAAADVIDLGLYGQADRRLAMRHGAEMDEEVAQLLLGVAYHDPAGLAGRDKAGIADLAAALGIEGGLVEDHRNLGADRGRLDRLAVMHDRQDLALGGLGRVAEELA